MPVVRPPARLAAVLVLWVIWFVAGGSPAAAHTELVSSDPPAGSHVDTAPETVTLVFSDVLHGWGTAVAVTAPGGVDVTGGAPVTDGGTVTQTLATGSPGAWTVAYRVVGEDGHVVEGTVVFEVTATPEVATPEVVAPEVAMPEVAMPEVAMPDERAVPAALATGSDDTAGPSRGLLAAVAGLALVAVAGMLLRHRPDPH